jgi:hypothetical protein
VTTQAFARAEAISLGKSRMARRSASANLWRDTKALLENVDVSVREDLNHILEHKIGYETRLMSVFGPQKMRRSVNLGGELHTRR